MMSRSNDMSMRRLMARPAAICCAWLLVVASAETQQRPSSGRGVRQVQDGAATAVFGRPALVVAATISSRCEIARGRDSVVFVEKQLGIEFTTDAPDIIRINKRISSDPTAANLTILQSTDSPFVELTLGQGYLLLLDEAPIARMLKMRRPLYVLAVPQGGFRIDSDGRLVPIVAGGELDAYRGRDARQLIDQIQQPRQLIRKYY